MTQLFISGSLFTFQPCLKGIVDLLIVILYILSILVQIILRRDTFHLLLIHKSREKAGVLFIQPFFESDKLFFIIPVFITEYDTILRRLLRVRLLYII